MLQQLINEFINLLMHSFTNGERFAIETIKQTTHGHGASPEIKGSIARLMLMQSFYRRPSAPRKHELHIYIYIINIYIYT